MLLALDTSTRQVGLALLDPQRGVLAEWTWRVGDYHTQTLAPMVRSLLAQVGVGWEEIQALGVALGPGSFTGLRVGLALAKGLAYARRLPLIGVPTLDVVAAGVPLEAKAHLVATLEAGRGRLAVNWYRPAQEGETPTAGGWVHERGPEVLTAEQLAHAIRQRTLVAGELRPEEQARLRRRWKKVRVLSPAWRVRRPALLAELAWARWQAGQRDDPATLAPMYLHTGTPIPA